MQSNDSKDNLRSQGEKMKAQAKRIQEIFNKD